MGVAKSRASAVSFRQSKSKIVRVSSRVVSTCCEIEETLEELLDWFDRDVAPGDVSCSSNSADGKLLWIIVIASETKRPFLLVLPPGIYISQLIELMNRFNDG